jgi:hypothetical protein
MRVALVVGLLAFLCTAACGGGSTQSSVDPDSGTNALTPAPGLCATDSRGSNFADGLKVAGAMGKYSVTIDTVDPAHPAKGDNTWTISVTNGSGAPVDNLMISTHPWMPDHRHGSSTIPTTTPMGSGKYQIGDLNLFMPGIWQITFTMDGTDGSDSAVFLTCVDS